MNKIVRPVLDQSEIILPAVYCTFMEREEKNKVKKLKKNLKSMKWSMESE